MNVVMISLKCVIDPNNCSAIRSYRFSSGDDILTLIVDSKPIMSSGNQVLVTFRTDDSVAASGFQLSYEQERESCSCSL